MPQEVRNLIYDHLTEPWEFSPFSRFATMSFALTGTVPTYAVRLICKRITAEYEAHTA